MGIESGEVDVVLYERGGRYPPRPDVARVAYVGQSTPPAAVEGDLWVWDLPPHCLTVRRHRPRPWWRRWLGR